MIALCGLVALGFAACGEGGEEGGPLMAPGRACLGCHAAGSGHGEAEQRPLGLAGTIYETRSGEQAAEGVTVVVVDGTGQRIEAGSNRVGNFLSTQHATAPLEVELQDAQRVSRMESPAPSGDCNSCHSAGGGAGRLTRP